jgi:choline dehydrogenase
MLSGIGPAEHLREHGITVTVDNPNVGSHLMDHPMCMLNFETTAKGTLAEPSTRYSCSTTSCAGAAC